MFKTGNGRSAANSQRLFDFVTTEANLISNITFQGLLYNKWVFLLLVLKQWNSSTTEEKSYTNIFQLKKCISREQENYMKACEVLMCFLMIATHLMEAVHWFKKGAGIKGFLQPGTVQSLDSSGWMDGWTNGWMNMIRLGLFGLGEPILGLSIGVAWLSMGKDAQTGTNLRISKWSAVKNCPQELI